MPNKRHAWFNNCFSSRLALLGSSTGIQACPMSRVSGSLVVCLRSRRLSKIFFPGSGCESTQHIRTFCSQSMHSFMYLVKLNEPLANDEKNQVSSADSHSSSHIGEVSGGGQSLDHGQYFFKRNQHMTLTIYSDT